MVLKMYCKIYICKLHKHILWLESFLLDGLVQISSTFNCSFVLKIIHTTCSTYNEKKIKDKK